jgi:hypothetical protein
MGSLIEQGKIGVDQAAAEASDPYPKGYHTLAGQFIDQLSNGVLSILSCKLADHQRPM